MGTEPDPRFSFANERTFLAWIRTALALLGVAVAIDVLDVSLPRWAQTATAALLAAMCAVSAIGAWTHWRRAERAMRLGRPLPAPRLLPLVAGVAVVGLVALGAVFVT